VRDFLSPKLAEVPETGGGGGRLDAD